MPLEYECRKCQCPRGAPCALRNRERLRSRSALARSLTIAFAFRGYDDNDSLFARSLGVTSRRNARRDYSDYIQKRRKSSRGRRFAASGKLRKQRTAGSNEMSRFENGYSFEVSTDFDASFLLSMRTDKIGNNFVESELGLLV